MMVRWPENDVVCVVNETANFIFSSRFFKLKQQPGGAEQSRRKSHRRRNLVVLDNHHRDTPTERLPGLAQFV
jgi:hypothetical protein